MFTPLNYPRTSLKLTKKENEVYVLCEFRKKKLLLTPEEWVRQHVLHFLIEHKSVPKNLIAAEYGIEVNKMSRRCDGVIFSRKGNAVAVIECKAPEIKLTQAVFQQIAQYNFNLRVDWLIMTNGLETIVAKVNQKTGEISYSEEIPEYVQML